MRRENVYMNTYYDDFDLDIQKVTYYDVDNNDLNQGVDALSITCDFSWHCPTLAGNNCGFTRTVSLCVCR